MFLGLKIESQMCGYQEKWSLISAKNGSIPVFEVSWLPNFHSEQYPHKRFKRNFLVSNRSELYNKLFNRYLSI
jgi:hypothetical protein